MSDTGRIVPPHASGGGFNVHRRTDPDETRGRSLYRALAEAEARRQLAYERHRAKLRDSDGTATAALCEDIAVPKNCQARAESIAQKVRPND